MTWLERLNDDPIQWLLEADPANPGVRYFALRDLLDRGDDAPEVREARAAISTTSSGVHSPTAYGSPSVS